MTKPVDTVTEQYTPRLIVSDLESTPHHTTIIVVDDRAAPSKRIREWWKRNRVVVIFAIMLVSTDRLVGVFAGLWESHSPDDYAAKLNGCRLEQRDMVFVGGSPVSEGIDPERIQGVKWGDRELKSIYNLGLSGGTTSDFFYAVLHACEKPPRVLVYGITASDLNDSRHEPHGPYSLMTWSDLAEWVNLRPESSEWVIRHFLLGRLGRTSQLFRYRHGIRMWAVSQASHQYPGCCPASEREADELQAQARQLETGSGYAPARGFASGRFDHVKAAGLTPKEFPYLRKYRTGSHLKYLYRLIDWCENHNVELVLLEMPVTADLENMYTAEFSEFRKRLSEVETIRHLRVIRTDRVKTGLQDSHFADLIHMNRDGGQRFSDWVREQFLSHSVSK